MRQGKRAAPAVLATVCRHGPMYADATVSRNVCRRVSEARRFMLGQGRRAKRAAHEAAPEQPGDGGAAGLCRAGGVAGGVAGGGEDKNVEQIAQQTRLLWRYYELVMLCLCARSFPRRRVYK